MSAPQPKNTSQPKNKPADQFADPREFRWIKADELIVDMRVQREVNPEKVARIVNEFDWLRFEALTVTLRKGGGYLVVEGQHRALAVKHISAKANVPCMVITSNTTDKTQAQIALDITMGRGQHNAYEKWRLRLNSGHPHEIAATVVMERHGVRVGQASSAMTISAVATVRSIVHGGNFTPEYGAELLDKTLTVLIAAFPTHDHESNVTRWNAGILNAVAQTLVRFPDADTARLARALRVRPAPQWVNLGKGVQGEPPWMVIARGMANEYNRNKRHGRIEL